MRFLPLAAGRWSGEVAWLLPCLVNCGVPEPKCCAVLCLILSQSCVHSFNMTICPFPRPCETQDPASSVIIKPLHSWSHLMPYAFRCFTGGQPFPVELSTLMEMS